MNVAFLSGVTGSRGFEVQLAKPRKYSDSALSFDLLDVEMFVFVRTK